MLQWYRQVNSLQYVNDFVEHKERYALSAKLSDFTVKRHTWWKN